MDEPTSVLTPQEVDDLFVTLRRLAAKAARSSISATSSRRSGALRSRDDHAPRPGRGRDAIRAKETARDAGRLMIGAELARTSRARRRPWVRCGSRSARWNLPTSDPVRHRAEEASVSTLHGGEVVGIAGIAGNGQGELLAALSGEQPVERPDAVVIDGHEVGRLGTTRPAPILAAAFVPEERLGHGAVPGHDARRECRPHRHRTGDELVRRRHRATAESAKFARLRHRRLRRAQGRRQSGGARQLSGGNLQKFVVGREVDREPGVLVVSQPTWGVDAGAAALIHQALVDLARAGAAVLVISAGPRRDFRDLRPHRRDLTRPSVVGGASGDRHPRVDRAADGRRR